MASKNSPTQDMWGWLVPGLGLVAVGMLIASRSTQLLGGAVILFGLGLCTWGVMKYERTKRDSDARSTPTTGG